MGQLERYGLYVLVLVIALIVGVSIWGGEPVLKEAEAGGATKLQNLELVRAPEVGRNVMPEVRPEVRNEAQPERRPDAGPRERGDLSELQRISEQLGGRGRGAVDDGRVGGGNAAPAAETQGARDYVIKPGDILGSIAQRELGSATRWQAILDANPGLDEKNLPVGKTIRIPAAAATRRRGTPAVDDFDGTVTYQSRVYKGYPHRVEEGETMDSISRRVFNTSRYTHVIVGINPDVNPKRLQKGMIIRVPTRDEIHRLH